MLVSPESTVRIPDLYFSPRSLILAKILVVDDEEKLCRVLKLLIEGEGHDVDTALNGEKGLGLLDNHVYDIVITDLKMPGMDGVEFLKAAKEKVPDVEVIMMTAFATTQSAVEAMKSGAYDYIIKPFDNDELLLILRRILEKKSLETDKAELARENQDLKRQIRESLDLGGMVGKGSRMQEVYSLVERVAGTSTTVLLRGESGTGKELVAKAIHYNSSRAEKTFVPIHCAAYPETLLESELFGHEKGSFTGAVNRRIGRFEKAAGGTIFLDEIGEVSSAVQVKLLRILQERCFERIGGEKTIFVDIRIIAATNRNLEQALEEGLFREDLYYRLNVFPVLLPPLRERMEDLEELVRHFLGKFGYPGTKITREAKAAMRSYSWPGNVRELENTIERALILSEKDSILEKHLPVNVREPEKKKGTGIPGVGKAGLNLETNEKTMIQEALRRAGGNKSRAAELLGITRRALYSRMERYEIPITGIRQEDEE